MDMQDDFHVNVYFWFNVVILKSRNVLCQLLFFFVDVDEYLLTEKFLEHKKIWRTKNKTASINF